MAFNTRPVNHSVPRQDATTLWKMQQDRDEWRGRALAERERRLAAEAEVTRIRRELEVEWGHIQALMRGEHANWWQKQKRLLPPGPAEVQERMTQQYQERKALVTEQFARSMEHANGDLERARRTAYEVIQTDKLE